MTTTRDEALEKSRKRTEFWDFRRLLTETEVQISVGLAQALLVVSAVAIPLSIPLLDVVDKLSVNCCSYVFVTWIVFWAIMSVSFFVAMLATTLSLYWSMRGFRASRDEEDEFYSKSESARPVCDNSDEKEVSASSKLFLKVDRMKVMALCSFVFGWFLIVVLFCLRAYVHGRWKGV